MKKAIVLLSGGLDSTTTLLYALQKGYKVHALIFDYGQRHKKEIKLAQQIAKRVGCPHQTVTIQMPWQGSALLDKKISLPKNRRLDAKDIPVTYVPARNIIFLSFAASFAEAVGAQTIFIGANFLDYSGYPDCRPAFYKAYKEVLRQGLKTGVKGHALKIETPLIYKTKADIVKLAVKLKVPIHLTWSCYAGGKKPCGVCDSCLFRAKGFKQVGMKDVAL